MQRIVNLGDILSGPLWAAATAERLMALDLPTIAGNHERQLLGAPPHGASDAAAAAELQPHQRDWLAALPPTLALSAQVLCCHGTPDSDVDYFLETPCPGFAGPGRGADGVRAATAGEVARRAGATLLGVPDALILCGHTHRPRVLRLPDGRLVVNPGSVGLQAYDEAQAPAHVIENRSPHARYALLELGPAGWSITLRAVAYDWEAAARRAAAGRRPDWADALRSGFVGHLENDLP